MMRRIDGQPMAPWTPGMSRFIAKNLDMPSQTLGIFCYDSAKLTNILQYKEKYTLFTPSELRCALQSPILPNPATVNFDLYMRGSGNRRHNNWLLEVVCFKYQHLQTMNLSLGRSSPSLAPLNALSHLRILKLRSFHRLGHACLRDVSIANLRELDYAIRDDKMRHREFMQLEKFIDRHQKLTHFDILILWPLTSDSRYNKRFANDIFHLLNYSMKNLKDLEVLHHSGYLFDEYLENSDPEQFHATTHLMSDAYTKIGFKLKLPFPYTESEETRVFTKTANGITCINSI